MTIRTSGQTGTQWRIAGWGVAVALLLLPFIAMRFTTQVNWTASDFAFAAILLGCVGFGLELAVRKSRNIAYRAGAASALLASLLVVWVNGAVGMIGSEDNPYNLLFGAAIVVALIGAAIARFRPAGMAAAMAGAAVVQGSLGTIGMFADHKGGILATLLAGLWILAAALFASASQGTGEQYPSS